MVYQCFIFWHCGCKQINYDSAYSSKRRVTNLLKEKHMETEAQKVETCSTEEPRILEEIQVEELAIDGICGVY